MWKKYLISGKDYTAGFSINNSQLDIYMSLYCNITLRFKKTGKNLIYLDPTSHLTQKSILMDCTLKRKQNEAFRKKDREYILRLWNKQIFLNMGQKATKLIHWTTLKYTTSVPQDIIKRLNRQTIELNIYTICQLISRAINNSYKSVRKMQSIN